MLLTLSSESNKEKPLERRGEQNPLSYWSRKSLHFTGPETEKNRRRTSFIERADTLRGTDLANHDAGNSVTWPKLSPPCTFERSSAPNFFLFANRKISNLPIFQLRTSSLFGIVWRKRGQTWWLIFIVDTLRDSLVMMIIDK